MALVDRAERANPIGGEVLELGAGGNAVVRVTLRGVILIPADVANILFHIVFVLGVSDSILFCLGFPLNPVNRAKIIDDLLF